MKNSEDKFGYSNRLDRNRAILLGRDLLEMNDWVVLSCKESALLGGAQAGDATELVSISVVGPGDRALMDVLVRPNGAVNSELLKLHGCDSAHIFNAPPFSGIHKILQAGFARTRVIAWNSQKVKNTLSRLCESTNLPALKTVYVDLQTAYTAFLGEIDHSSNGDAYKTVVLPPQTDCSTAEVTPLTECRYLLTLVQEMAGSSQSTEAAAFDKNWSAAFYKPKLGPTQKLKEFLGLDNGQQ